MLAGAIFNVTYNLSLFERAMEEATAAVKALAAEIAWSLYCQATFRSALSEALR